MNLYKERQKRVFSLMEKNKVDSFLITDLTNIRYLCGFTGSNGYLLFFDDRVYFYTDFRYALQSEREVFSDKIFIIKKNFYLSPPKEILKVKRLAIEKENLTVDNYEKLLNYLKKKKKKIKFLPLANVIKELRAIKDEEEISLIKKAASLTDEVFNKVLKEIKEGMKEKDLALFIEGEFKKNGDIAFPVIVASGENSALPHAKPSEKEIKFGEAIVIDIGLKYNGYCADLTRTVFLGKISDEFKKVYQIVYDAQKKAIDFLSFSISKEKKIKAKAVDLCARNYIKEKGYGEFFGHSLGHGVGLEVHEKPWVSFLSKDRLKPNMVFTVEPGIYLPKKGGVRIEDLVLLKEKEVILLSESEKNLIVL